MITNTKHISLIILICLLLFHFNNCARVLQTYEGRIVGKVRLSDNPPTGNGGVDIYTDTMATNSRDDGKFSLEGSIVRNGMIDLYFEKSGYITKILEIHFDNFEFYENERINICEIGEVVLERISS